MSVFLYQNDLGFPLQGGDTTQFSDEVIKSPRPLMVAVEDPPPVEGVADERQKDTVALLVVLLMRHELQDLLHLL